MRKSSDLGYIPEPKLAAVVMALSALLVPFLISTTPMADITLIVASTWMADISGLRGYELFYGPIEWAAMSPLTLLRFIFVIQVFRYYKGKSTRKRTLIIGILIEAPLWISVILFALPGWGVTMSFPLPFLLLTGAFLLWRYPRLEADSLWEGQQEEWWSASQDASDSGQARG